MTDENEEFRETEREKFDRGMREFEAKNVQNYAVNLTMWFTTKLEKDKSIITISSAAIGLLVTIITAKGVQSLCQATFYGLALLSFLTAIICAINVLDENAEHIQLDLTNQGNRNQSLKRKDFILNTAFYLGIVFTIFVGISYGVNQFISESGERKMTKENERSGPTRIIKEGFEESDKLRPTPPRQEPPKESPNKKD